MDPEILRSPQWEEFRDGYLHDSNEQDNKKLGKHERIKND